MIIQKNTSLRAGTQEKKMAKNLEKDLRTRLIFSKVERLKPTKMKSFGMTFQLHHNCVLPDSL